MKAVRFISKPFVVGGFEVELETMETIAAWCEGHVITDAERPFIRVPVNRPTNRKQTEAYVGTFVLLSIYRGEKSFKVYTMEWLEKNFNMLPGELDGALTLPRSAMAVEDLNEDNMREEYEVESNVHPLPVPVTFRAAQG